MLILFVIGFEINLRYPFFIIKREDQSISIVFGRLVRIMFNLFNKFNHFSQVILY